MIVYRLKSHSILKEYYCVHSHWLHNEKTTDQSFDFHRQCLYTCRNTCFLFCFLRFFLWFLLCFWKNIAQHYKKIKTVFTMKHVINFWLSITFFFFFKVNFTNVFCVHNWNPHLEYNGEVIWILLNISTNIKFLYLCKKFRLLNLKSSSSILPTLNCSPHANKR